MSARAPFAGEANRRRLQDDAERERLGEFLGIKRRDDEAAPLAAHEAFRLELLQRRPDGGARAAQPGLEHPLNQGLARQQLKRQDEGSQLRVGDRGLREVAAFGKHAGRHRAMTWVRVVMGRRIAIRIWYTNRREAEQPGWWPEEPI